MVAVDGEAEEVMVVTDHHLVLVAAMFEELDHRAVAQLVLGNNTL